MLLLDTHVWIWNVEGDVRRLGRRARQLLSREESEEGLRISSASIFEVTALHTAGRLHLANPPEQWIRDALHAIGGNAPQASGTRRGRTFRTRRKSTDRTPRSGFPRRGSGSDSAVNPRGESPTRGVQSRRRAEIRSNW